MDLKPDVLVVRVHAHIVGAVHELGVQLDWVRRLGLDGAAVGHEGHEEDGAAAGGGADVGGGFDHDL